MVEDNPVNQMVATGLLAALGYTSEVAPDGLAAIEAVRERDFDAVLMDVQMPHMDGYTATRHIRATETGQRLPIIAMTAAAVEGERERCLAAGMDDYLTKPVDPAAAGRDARALAVLTGPSYADRLDMDRLAELRELDDPGDSVLPRPGHRQLPDRRPQGRRDGDHRRGRRTARRRGRGGHRLAGVPLNLGAGALGEAAGRSSSTPDG